MQVRITRLDKSLPLPAYETKGAVGFDILAAKDMEVAAGEVALVPTGLIIEVPDGYMLALASRSSTPRKKGLSTPHGVGIIDRDYCGPTDELLVQVYNFTVETVRISKGEKIAQGVFMRVDCFEWEEVEEIRSESRGGFGSTGGYHQNLTMKNARKAHNSVRR